MALTTGSIYEVTIGPFSSGDTIEYYIVAVDDYPTHNSATDDNSGLYYTFDVVFKDILGPTIQDVEHSPMNPTDTTAVTIFATINDTSGLQSVYLCFRTNGGIWANITMSVYSGDIYSVSLGILDYDDFIEYYIIAIDNSPNANSMIDDNSASYYSFTVVSGDVTEPIITNIIQSAANITTSESITISCMVTDLSGLDVVTLYYRIDGGSWISIEMIETTTNNYSITLGSFAAGSFVQYYIEAVDDSPNSNDVIDDNDGNYYFFKVNADPTTSTVVSPFIGGFLSLLIITSLSFIVVKYLKHKMKNLS
jgi:hypothetical protein